MTSVRVRTSATGAAVAVAAGVLTNHGAALGADLAGLALLGVVAGAVVGLVPDRSAPARAGAFVLGLVAAWGGFALRAGALPDIPLGRALAAVLVVSAVTAVAAATHGRLPLWAGLSGAATLVGAYATTYSADPAAFTSESTTAVTAVLLAAAVGFVVTTLLATEPSVEAVAAPQPAEDTVVEASGPGALSTLFPSPRGAADAAPTEIETSR